MKTDDGDIVTVYQIQMFEPEYEFGDYRIMAIASAYSNPMRFQTKYSGERLRQKPLQ